MKQGLFLWIGSTTLSAFILLCFFIHKINTLSVFEFSFFEYSFIFLLFLFLGLVSSIPLLFYYNVQRLFLKKGTRRFRLKSNLLFLLYFAIFLLLIKLIAFRTNSDFYEITIAYFPPAYLLMNIVPHLPHNWIKNIV
jgi:hypothetical protein